jgi:hypothetical protein
MTMLSSLSEHGPGHSLCPTREAGTIPPTRERHPSGAVCVDALLGITLLGITLLGTTACRAGRLRGQQTLAPLKRADERGPEILCSSVGRIGHASTAWAHLASRPNTRTTCAACQSRLSIGCRYAMFVERRNNAIRARYSVHGRLASSPANCSHASAIRSNDDRAAWSTESFHISRQRFAQW